RRRKQQQTPSILGDPADTSYEALLKPPRHRLRLRQPEASGKLHRRQSSWQLEQRQRIPAELRDDPVEDALVQLEPQRRAKQRADVAVAQSPNVQPLHVLELRARLAR